MEKYKAALEWTHRAMFNHPSIVNTSLVSAIEGHYGNYHANYRTQGSHLYINALMTLLWCFDLPVVARRNLYLGQIADTETLWDLAAKIATFRARNQAAQKDWESLPM